MKQELKMMEQNQNQNSDEIDIYELIEIMIRNKKIILITFLTVFLFSIFGAYYNKNKNSSEKIFFIKEYFINRDLLKNNILDGDGKVLKTVVGVMDPKSIFLKNSRVESMFQLEEISKIYDGKNDFYNKKEFLEKFFNVQEKSISQSENTILTVKILQDVKEKDAGKIFDLYEENLKDSAIVLAPSENVEILSVSDIYKENIPPSNKAKLILGAGIVMGLFLGIMMAFFKDFIDGYKNRHKR